MLYTQLKEVTYVKVEEEEFTVRRCVCVWCGKVGWEKAKKLLQINYSKIKCIELKKLHEQECIGIINKINSPSPVWANLRV